MDLEKEFTRKNGFLEIPKDYLSEHKIKDIDCPIDKVIINDIVYYLKKLNYNNAIVELIMTRLANKVGISASSNDIAIIDEEIYLLSKEIKENGYTYIDGNDFLQNYGKENENNLANIYQQLKIKFGEDKASEVIREFNKLFTFDILTNSIDRRSSNWILKINENNVSLAPIYDNSRALIGAENYHYQGIKVNDTKETDLENELQTYLKTINDEYLELFVEMYNYIDEDRILEVITEIEKEIKAPIHNKRDIMVNYINHQRVLVTIFIECMKERGEGNARK